ncbi:unnamed protein product, partial [Dovyalis caffra]
VDPMKEEHRNINKRVQHFKRPPLPFLIPPVRSLQSPEWLLVKVEHWLGLDSFHFEEEEEEGRSSGLEKVPLMVGPIEPWRLEESIIVFSQVYAMAQFVPLKMNSPKMDR